MNDFSIKDYMNTRYALPPNVIDREVPPEQIASEEKFRLQMAETSARAAGKAAEELKVAADERQANHERVSAEAARLAETVAGKYMQLKYGWSKKGK